MRVMTDNNPAESAGPGRAGARKRERVKSARVMSTPDVLSTRTENFTKLTIVWIRRADQRARSNPHVNTGAR